MRILCICLVMLLLAGCGQATNTMLQTHTNSYAIHLTIDTHAQGDERILIEVHDDAGQPVVADAVSVFAVMTAMGHTEPEHSAAIAAPGRYQLERDVFTMIGAWELDVIVQAGATSETARFVVNVQ